MVRTKLGDYIIFDLQKMLGNDHLFRKYYKIRNFKASYLHKLLLNSTFLDIGAHIGDTTLTMAAYAKRIKRTDINFIAIEADKDKCNFIEEMAKVNNFNIKVLCYAIGNKNIKVKPNDYSKSAAVCYKETDEGLQMICLDSIEEQLGNISFMHVDIEGWETEMLKGSKNILRNHNPVIILECWDNEISTKKGFSKNPEEDIVNIFANYEKYERLEDIVDGDKNLVFKSKYF